MERSTTKHIGEIKMGSNLATELADSDLFPDLSLEDSIAIQLRSNHYPPVPLSMVQPCIEAIQACNDEMSNKLITLPEGITWRNEPTAPAWAIVEGHHLDAWIVSYDETE
jgi:hypothetical protein